MTASDAWLAMDSALLTPLIASLRAAVIPRIMHADSVSETTNVGCAWHMVSVIDTEQLHLDLTRPSDMKESTAAS